MTENVVETSLLMYLFVVVYRKFICLNDNLDPERSEDNAVAKAILQDMYESLFPKPSSFELPPEFRNRFLHIDELQAWRKTRNTIRTIVYICLAILIAFTLVNFFHIEVRYKGIQLPCRKESTDNRKIGK